MESMGCGPAETATSEHSKPGHDDLSSCGAPAQAQCRHLHHIAPQPRKPVHSWFADLDLPLPHEWQGKQKWVRPEWDCRANQ